MVSQRADGIVEFSYYRPDVNAVDMIGALDHEQPQSYRMTLDEEGWWRLALPIREAGDFIYKYQVDGEVGGAIPIRNHEEWFRVFSLAPIEKRAA